MVAWGLRTPRARDGGQNHLLDQPPYSLGAVRDVGSRVWPTEPHLCEAEEGAGCQLRVSGHPRCQRGLFFRSGYVSQTLPRGHLLSGNHLVPREFS